MMSVPLVADTNVISYMFERSPLGIAYRDLIDGRRVGFTGHTLAELRAGTVINKWGDRRLNADIQWLEQFTYVPCTSCNFRVRARRFGASVRGLRLSAREFARCAGGTCEMAGAPGPSARELARSAATFGLLAHAPGRLARMLCRCAQELRPSIR
jgi:hypothetical protein